MTKENNKETTLKFSVDPTALDRKLLRGGVVTLLFLYVYAPRLLFLPLNFSYLTILVAIAYFSLGNNLTRLAAFFRIKAFVTFLYFYLFCVLYTIFVLIFSAESNNNAFLISYIRLLIDVVLVVPFFVIVYRDELGYKMDDLLKELVIIATVQGVFAVFMLAIPPLKDFIYSNVIALSDSRLDSMLSYRGFAIANSFSFSMPLFQSLALVAVTKLFFEKKRIYLLCFPFLLVSMVTNARISLVMIPVFLCVVFIMSFYYDDMRWIRKLLGLFFMFLLLVLGLVIYFVFNPDKLQVILWAVEGFTGIIKSMLGSSLDSPTLRNIVRTHLHLPQQLNEILFGKGLIVFDNPRAAVMSDLGVIQYIYYGGILLSVIFYFNMINFARSCFSLTRDRFMKILLISMNVMLFIAHIKGNIFNSSAYMTGLLLIQLFLLYDNKDRKTA